MNATEHLIEAMHATKMRDQTAEERHLRFAHQRAACVGGCALDLSALLSALAEIVIGEKCVPVPVRELEAVLAARPSLATNPFPVDAILARLPAPKVDAIEWLSRRRSLIERAIDDEGSRPTTSEKIRREWIEERDALTEAIAAIKARSAQV
ncbi:MAG: hypothetical protein EKK55_00925 [Rhodocyclaceae bacterium]|nr:MAG: hypothetical protein EKK55_00925 [Rhodocyclaceae bacterium]